MIPAVIIAMPACTQSWCCRVCDTRKADCFDTWNVVDETVKYQAKVYEIHAIFLRTPNYPGF